MRYLLIISFIFLTSVAQSQEKRKNIAISYGFGNGSIGPFEKLEGGGSNDGKSISIFSINYLNEIGKHLYLETGINYLNYQYTFTAPYYGGSSPRVISERSVKLISIPLKARLYLGKHFFFNGGLLADIDISEQTIYHDNKKLSGLGAGAGFGLAYNFTQNLGVFINPSLNFRNLIPFTQEKYYDRLVERNIALGLIYTLK